MSVLTRLKAWAGAGVAEVTPAAPTARMMRDTPTGILGARLRSTAMVDSREEIRRSWRDAATMALDFIQNSGRLKGACDQVLADTVGVELTLTPQPNLAKLGYSEKETADFVRLVKQRWNKWAWNPSECDLRGKFTVPQMVDIGLRWTIAYGEVTGILSYMGKPQRDRYGIQSGTKVCLVPPPRLVQDTNHIEGLFQGVYHDENGRPVSYLFEEREAGIRSKKPYAARDDQGRHGVIHIFDPADATDVRGISVLTSAFRKHAQHEMLDDATLQTAILQTLFAAVLTSAAPSADAFQAIEALEDIDKSLAAEISAFLGAKFEAARSSKINMDGAPHVSHMAPGEDLQFRTAATPGSQYLDFSASLSRDMARAIGISYGGLTMDHTDATYSSVRMENASIWPVVMRRRERIAAPINQMIYENWLDEEIGEGRIPLKGGYRAFRANLQDVCWAQWQGPAKPTADDFKSERAATERLQNGTSSLAIECAEKGIDPDEMFEQRKREHQRHLDAGLPSPFAPRGQQLPLVDDGDEKKKAA